MAVSDSSAVPVTATGTEPLNYAGQAIAITVFSTLKWWGRFFLWVLFFVTARKASLTKDLRDLSFIHFARWSVVRKIPYNGAPQPKTRLRHPHMYFESNFNGGWEEYIDAFSHILAGGMKAFWGSSFGFPNALPVSPFKDYIKVNESVANHFYSAYPEATSTMIQRALALDKKFAALKRDAPDLEPEVFAKRYEKFLTDAQHCL